MATNHRSKPIEGHVSDSAGNILRNTVVVIKQPTASGVVVVDSVQTDDDGQFISLPCPNGVYDIYESGSKISRIIHCPDSNKIQCFKASSENFDLSSVSDFNTLAANGNLNSFKAYIQLESLSTDVYQYGNIFSIYDRDVLNLSTNEPSSDLYNIAKFYGFNSNSRLTLTRFDVSYYSPLTVSNKIYQSIRWAGVPAIKFYKDSRLVIPLDYYSIIANNPKSAALSLSSNDVKISTDIIPGHASITGSELVDFSNSVSIGDIVKIQMTDGTTPGIYYGIINAFSAGTEEKTISLEMWKNSRYASNTILPNAYVSGIFAYDGMFSGIMNVNEDINQRFTVVENIFAQDGVAELYNYSNQ